MLSLTEGRVLGCLLEKERTVPDQYPLTLTSLLAACNQTTSRVPVMTLDVGDVDAAAAALKAHGWARVVHPSHGRAVVRYRQVAVDKLGLGEDDAAVLAVLLLRGPQTPAEIRQHGERLHRFETAEHVVQVLQRLAERGEPLVRRSDRSPGQSGQRWQQVVADEVAVDVSADAPVVSPSLASRVSDLEARVERLETLLRALE